MVENSVIMNQDDCLAINRGTSITFQNNRCSGGHSISVGYIDSDRVVSDVHITGNTVTNLMQCVLGLRRMQTLLGVVMSVSILYSLFAFADSSQNPRAREARDGAATIPVPHEFLPNCKSRKSGGRRKCTNNVKLHAEVYAKDIMTASIYQLGTHNEAAKLAPSLYLRQIILMDASIADMTAGRIQRQLIHDFDRFDVPLYRRPDNKQILNMVSNVRRRERLISNPLLAIGIFAKHNPDKVFSYVYSSNEAFIKFQVGIKNDYCVQNMVLYARANGLGLDSSYRNKNEDRAPVTFLVTLDKNKRMLPGTKC
ncbi:hypothetical protein D9758_015888 [Tetrapyrgos nigripes]|uniref:Uncharacterized protein n=1 Tax=Tetrapyrgos nigripes TaxID=182062 RepID=A0A8H5CMZ9_9AGAR|nr:hypothetical protein D9758_015888 [Tetrapyrgos nigripes]